jgi:8-oxo-dGTP pyrophosphatase MutT (NUDIX family)
MVWKPHLTVAAVIERNNRFLLVEERTPNGIQFNQPAGHLEENENLLAAVKREVYEETAWQFEPEHVIGIYLWRKYNRSPTFVRICFSGYCHSFQPDQPLDSGIISTHWLSPDEINVKRQQKLLRSPLVMQNIEDYLNGNRYPLTLIKSHLNPT